MSGFLRFRFLFQFLLLLPLLFWNCFAPPDVLSDQSLREPLPSLEILVLHNLAESLGVVNADRWAAGESPWWSDALRLTESVPNRLLVYEDHIYIVNSSANSVALYARSSLALLATLSLGPGQNPWDIAVFEQAGRRYLFVSAFLSDRIAVLEQVGDTLNLAGWLSLNTPSGLSDYRPRPEGLAVVNEQLFVANSGWDFQTSSFFPGYVSVFDVSGSGVGEWVQLSNIRVGTNPQSLLTVSNELHVISSGLPGENDGLISVIAAGSLEKGTTLAVGGSPYRGVYGAGRVYLGGMNRVMSYRPSEPETSLHDYANPFWQTAGENSYLAGIAFDETNSMLYVCDFSRDSLFALDTNGSCVRELAVGDGPLDLGLSYH